MIGRENQIALINETLQLGKSSFVAVTGRRRVGKTFLIDQLYGDAMCLRVTGIQGGTTVIQINNFVQKIREASGNSFIPTPSDWQQLFILLKDYLKKRKKSKKQVIFLDELPWMCTPKSGFIQLLAHLWNDYLSKEKHFILVVCGSATSWISKKIINDKGGFHNRLTHVLQLKPFTLAETKLFLERKRIALSDSAIAEIYMVMGGIPFYLENIKRGESPVVAIGRMCFSENGILKYEYTNLYKALFDYPENHEAVIAALATSIAGLSREDIIKKSKVDAGGPYTRTMNDLIASGFVVEERPFGKKKRGTVHRLVDEYSVFYHTFIKNNLKTKTGIWQILSSSQSYKIWAGYAFETLCAKHIGEIKKALGIQNVYTEVANYRSKGRGGKDGFQIDLIIDRKDQAINLFECKFYEASFEVSKKYAEQLQWRKSSFKSETETKKIVFNTLITNKPIKPNQYSLDAVDVSLTVSEIMKR
jgi:uncharacterized protein